MYASFEEYVRDVAEYITGEFTDWTAWLGQEDELATHVLLADAKHRQFLEYCYKQRYLRGVPGECLVRGVSADREVATYSGSPHWPAAV